MFSSFNVLDKSSTFFLRSIDSCEKNNSSNPRSKLRGFKKVLDKEQAKGFALYKLVFFLAIMSVAGLFTIIYLKPEFWVQGERDKARRGDIKYLAGLIQTYKVFHGAYPAENICDTSVGSQNSECPLRNASSSWDKESAFFKGISENGQKVPNDPINSTTYYYAYELDVPGDEECSLTARGACSYWIGARLEKPKDPSKPIYRCSDRQSSIDEKCKEVTDWGQ